eukprot:6201265-Pleurochrysis_carterae.AAC.9
MRLGATRLCGCARVLIAVGAARGTRIVEGEEVGRRRGRRLRRRDLRDASTDGLGRGAGRAEQQWRKRS